VGSQGFRSERHSLAHCQDAEQLVHSRQGGGLIHSNGHRVRVHHAQVAALLHGSGSQLLRLAGGHDLDSVEKRRLLDLEAELGGTHGNDAGHAVRTLRDGLQALRAVVHGIHGCHVGQQRLRRADVAGGLIAANVLLASLHGHAQGRLSLSINADTDDAAGHEALVLVAG